MKKVLFFIILLGALAQPFSVLAAQQVKLKYYGSIYTDADGLPLQEPSGLSYHNGMLLIADSGSRSILSYRFELGAVKPVGRFLLPKRFPLQVQQAANGDIYFLDGRLREIVVLGPDGHEKGTFNPQGVPDGRRIVPRSFKVYNDGTILILDIFSERVLVLDNSGNFLQQIAFPDRFGFLVDVIRDKKGNIYLLDSVEALVYMATAGSDQFQALTTGMKDYMNFPTSLATDNSGSLYLVDKYGSGLAIVGTDGRFSGRKMSMGWKENFVYYPSNICISESGDLFIADTGNHRVQHLSITD